MENKKIYYQDPDDGGLDGHWTDHSKYLVIGFFSFIGIFILLVNI